MAERSALSDDVIAGFLSSAEHNRRRAERRAREEAARAAVAVAPEPTPVIETRPRRKRGARR